MKNSVIMAFTRAEKPHLLLPNSRRCFVHVWRGVFFIATFLSHTQRGEWIQPCFGFLFLSHMTKTNYPWLFLPVDWFCLAGIFFSLHSYQRTLKIERMEIYYIEAGVLERMLTCFENLSTHVTDCMRENVVRNSENDWAVRMSACSLTSHRILLSFDR